MIGFQIIEGRSGGVAPSAVGKLIPVRGPVHVAVGSTSPEDGAYLPGESERAITASGLDPTPCQERDTESERVRERKRERQ